MDVLKIVNWRGHNGHLKKLATASSLRPRQSHIKLPEKIEPITYQILLLALQFWIVNYFSVPELEVSPATAANFPPPPEIVLPVFYVSGQLSSFVRSFVFGLSFLILLLFFVFSITCYVNFLVWFLVKLRADIEILLFCHPLFDVLLLDLILIELVVFKNGVLGWI